MGAKSWYVLVAALALAAGIAAQRWMGAEPVVPVPATEPVLRDLDGRIRTLAEWRGRVVVLNFWASWCTPCLEEMPEFVRLQKELGGRGLQFVGVAIDEAEAVRDFLQETPVNYPILIADERGPEWAESLGDRIGALPFSVVFDRTGKPTHTRAGIFPRREVLEAVSPLLDRETPG